MLSSRFDNIAAKIFRLGFLIELNLCHVPIGSLERTVHRVEGDVQKKWPVVVAVDKINCLAGDRVGQVLRSSTGWPPR